MGISKCRLEFSKDNEGTLYYTNETGSHQISFGVGHVKQQIFPDINLFSISSAAWVDEKTLHLRSYIIEELPGNVNMTITFINNAITISMKKIAEDALHEYEGFASGELEA